MAAGRRRRQGILVEQLLNDDAGALRPYLWRYRQQCLGAPADVIGLPQRLGRSRDERQAHCPGKASFTGPHASPAADRLENAAP